MVQRVSLMVMTVALCCAASGVVAHVTLTPSTGVLLGTATYVNLQVPHGCDGDNTIGVDIRVPYNATVAAVSRENWTLTREMRTDAPTKVLWYRWSANDNIGLLDWQLHLFTIRATFPASYYTSGQKVFLQVVQHCRNVTGDLSNATDYWTLVSSPAQYGADVDQDLAVNAAAETSPSITLLSAASTTIAASSTGAAAASVTYIMQDSSDQWTAAHTIGIIALVLAAGAVIGLLWSCTRTKSASSTAYGSAPTPKSEPLNYTPATPAPAPVAAATPTPAPVAAGVTIHTQ